MVDTDATRSAAWYVMEFSLQKASLLCVVQMVQILPIVGAAWNAQCLQKANSETIAVCKCFAKAL